MYIFVPSNVDYINFLNNYDVQTRQINSKTTVWLFITTIVILFFSCEKDDDPFKECRKNPDCEYFTCKVNGKRWEPRCISEPLFGCTPWDVQYYRNIPALDIYIDNEKENEHFTFLIRNSKLSMGENKLFINDDIQTRFSNLNNSVQCVRFKLDTLKAYSFYISKIDSINYYLSGKFHFTGKNECGEEVLITEGEFNLPYRF